MNCYIFSKKDPDSGEEFYDAAAVKADSLDEAIKLLSEYYTEVSREDIIVMSEIPDKTVKIITDY